ncbi:MAG: alpha/beta hydrolase [Verrucomicrobiota bacterium JB022]|nr:alpha/beta hydrolase [Verrucomicrobiota bacterium JB022]
MLKTPLRLFFALTLLLTAPLQAAEPEVVQLWPEGVPGLKPDAKHEEVINGRIFGIHYPTMVVFRPDATAPKTGSSVIFCPGGGYERLAVAADGGYETKFLNRLGVTVFVLKYRNKEYGHPAPLQDITRAVRIVRSRAAEFGLDPERVGVMGASAGGHVVASAATLWDAPEVQTGADLDEVSARPDFAILIYPVITMEEDFAHGGSRRNLIGENPSAELVKHLSLEQQVSAQTPPTIIIATRADRSVPVQNSLHYYEALVEAGVAAEMHVYAEGTHGNSRDPQYGPTALWPKRVTEWLAFNGWSKEKE